LRAFEFKPKKKKKLNLTGYQSNRPVNRSNRPVSRSEPVEHAILNLNLNLTGFHRFPAKPSGIPVPDPAGLTGPVGKLNPGHRVVAWAPQFLQFSPFRERISHIGPFCNFLYKWTLGVGAVNCGAELTRLRATDHGVEVQPGIRRGPRLGAVDLGAEIGATVLGAEPFLPSGKGGSQSI